MERGEVFSAGSFKRMDGALGVGDEGALGLGI